MHRPFNLDPWNVGRQSELNHGIMFDRFSLAQSILEKLSVRCLPGSVLRLVIPLIPASWRLLVFFISHEGVIVQQACHFSVCSYEKPISLAASLLLCRAYQRLLRAGLVAPLKCRWEHTMESDRSRSPTDYD